MAQLGEWGDGDLGLVSVCDITFCCGKKVLRQPADCAHCLPLCDFTDCTPELWDLQKHINCMRHRCQHADCLSFYSRWENFSHILQRGQFGGKVFPAYCDFTLSVCTLWHTQLIQYICCTRRLQSSYLPFICIRDETKEYLHYQLVQLVVLSLIFYVCKLDKT